MKKTISFTIVIFLWTFSSAYSQLLPDTLVHNISKDSLAAEEVKGFVFDANKQIALPYTTILVLHKNKGSITNEKGFFSINITGLDITDSLRFQYVGYKTKLLSIAELDTTSIVYLEEDIINLSETLIFGNAPNPVFIVKQVLINKDSNYKTTTTRNQIFVRKRDVSKIDDFVLKLKKSTINELNEELAKKVEEIMPRVYTSYTDFLGQVYFTANKKDSVRLKVDPIKTVSLNEQDFSELEQLETIFEDLFTDTQEKEYWKVKSGIFGQKIDIDEDSTVTNSDSLPDNMRKLPYFAYGVYRNLKFTTFDDKKEWEFLHSTGKYNYELIGGSSVNGEDVYIIDFTPKNSGKYYGRVYISVETYALIRADYKYAPEKTGRDIHLLGIGYTENQFNGSIYYEKTGDRYSLKYFSKKTANQVSFDRKIALLKKRKRFLFDKLLKEIKVGVDLSMTIEESLEYLVLDRNIISAQQYSEFKQEENMEIIYVDQFDKDLWEGFSIIEPTQQMREYKKHDVNYSE